ncbi:undecaprenyl-diphosphatase [Parabacteroides sp. PF5-5]|uniref:undecaprenyl-diphosphate phosphatase n=1 Tax=unclassified Parabacteroides TaxID=2649774 RepID=UPI002473B40F|nr:MULTISPECIES: undecaprenyl-diphosphate phosphatase [unclassified Parabacteroides]MDH6306627.1 undecaprenyl-diphosphatase [Parabacteroides sp. PH5-39]MDH6317594.1 undecaprenyl-diphosphatase [Parabacteroides sp. PF5-13]MDH6321338.1 undecaprenyl-diphosphatase [Parabacteroides sp. PH5-13]MDH6325097.1 undecaprenyl-diphosphatase [Parabacteroides sp. PH5-8]MDH6328806.1 undecaprenyl-diphosphatase [Parabacteroides sp. PH5-41]
MSWLEALILGIIQGLTEFLPVSSSGHLTIGSTLFGLSGEENLTFAVVVHAATVLSTIVVLWSEISKLFIGFFRFKWNDETKMVCKILLSMIPVGIVGVFFKDYVEQLFGSGLLLVGCMLLVTAALLAFSYYAKPRVKEEISFKDAFIIGIAQACAVLPGLSRSGSTIATGLLLGNKKEQVAQFSFLMVIIPILGEAFLDLIKGGFSPETSGISTTALATGFLAAFVCGAIACKWMINLVKKGKLIYFAYYCVAAGLLAITFSFIN